MSRRLEMAAWGLIIGLNILCYIAFLGVVNNTIQPRFDQTDSLTYTLFHRLDSLENVVNDNLVSRKDTVLIHVVPQEIKIYNK